ncbi:MAG TPA: DUF1508 domain-containing protein [Chthoniobacterales bacterium]|jgi:uncharacterized protein YegP (UPF0339 family)
MAKFLITEDKKGVYRWKLVSGNGQIIALSGESYKAKDSCVNGIEAVKRDAGTAKVFQVVEE